MPAPFYKKRYFAKDILTTGVGTTEALTVDFDDLPSAVGATGADTVVHIEVMDVFVDFTNPVSTTGLHNTTIHHKGFVVEAGGTLASGNMVLVSRTFVNGAPDNVITWATGGTYFQVFVANPTGSSDGSHFVGLEVSFYRAID